MFDQAAYTQLLQAMLPPGAAFTRDPDSQLTKLLSGFAAELTRIDGRAAQLLDEADPTSALELLADWEKLLGLPDTCVPVTGSVRERQLAAANAWAAQGGQSRAYFTALAARLGFVAEIDEFEAMTCDSDCIARVNDDRWAHAWEVSVLDGDNGGDYADAWFTADSGADESVRTAGSQSLECLIARTAPAHTTVLFSYEVDPEPLFWFDFVNP